MNSMSVLLMGYPRKPNENPKSILKIKIRGSQTIVTGKVLFISHTRDQFSPPLPFGGNTILVENADLGIAG